MVTSVVVCLISLGAVLGYVAARGSKAISAGFFTHSMAGIAPD